MKDEWCKIQEHELVKVLNVTGIDPVDGKLCWVLFVVFDNDTDMEVKNENLAKGLHTVMRYLQIPISRAACEHSHFADGYCGEMICWNYYSRNRNDDSIVHGNFTPKED